MTESSDSPPLAINYTRYQYFDFDAYVADTRGGITYQFFPIAGLSSFPGSDEAFGTSLNEVFKAVCTSCTPNLSAEAQYYDKQHVEIAGILRPDDAEGDILPSPTFWVRVPGCLTYPMVDDFLKEGLFDRLDRALRADP